MTVLGHTSQQPIKFVTAMLADKATKQPITGTTTGADETFNIKVTSLDFTLSLASLAIEKGVNLKINPSFLGMYVIASKTQIYAFPLR